MRRQRIIVSGLIILALCAAARAQEAAQVTFSGKITGPDEVAVKGADLKLYSITVDSQDAERYLIELCGQARSDAEGGFSFSIDKSNTRFIYTCIGEKKGFSYGWRTIFQDGQPLDIRLTEPHKMIGYVQDADGGKAGDVEVRLILTIIDDQLTLLFGMEPIDVFMTRTCADGRFEFNRLPAGASAEILVTTKDKGTVHTISDLTNMESGLTYAAGRTDIVLTLQKPRSISGVVVAKDEQTPVAGIPVRVSQEIIPMRVLGIEPVVTQADGTFRIDNLQPGQYNLTVDTTDWLAEPLSVNVQEDVETRIELFRGGMLEVKVIDDETGEPVENAHVFLCEGNSSILRGYSTNKDGVMQRQLSPGVYSAEVTGPNYRREANRDITIASGKTESMQVRLKARPKFVGTVVNPDGSPASGTKIVFLPYHSEPIQSDAEGRFTLAIPEHSRGWDEGQFSLIAADAKNNLAAVETINEDMTEVRIVLKNAGRIRGKVFDEQKRPLKDASVRLTYWGPQGWGTSYGDSVMTDETGMYVINAVPMAETFSISIRGPKGYGSVSVSRFTVDCDPQSEYPIEDAVLRKADLKIAGRILDNDGNPMENAQVSLYGDGQPDQTVKTDKDGRFVFEHACSGPAQLNAYHHGGSVYLSGRSQTEGGVEDVEIVLFDRNRARAAQPIPVSLVGKALPDTGQFGFELPVDADSILVFVWDLHQRPSRHFVRELAAGADFLAEKRIHVCLLHTGTADKETLDAWLKEHEIPYFSIASTGDPQQTRFKLGVQAMPWLILVNRTRTVTAEGFAPHELADKLKDI